MDFKEWLMEIGKSERTASSYSTAITGVISNWAVDSGLAANVMGELHSVKELMEIYKGLQNIDIYIQRNERGNNMYSCAFKLFIEYRKCETSKIIEQDISNIICDDLVGVTEKTTYISARVGQGKYRNNLIGYWERCALTGFSDIRFLVASHIKPWKYANNTERLDPFNGLLLLPNIDKVFDLGFISFSDKGNIIVSDYLEEPDRLGIAKNMHLKLEGNHLQYMKFHRNKVYERNV